MFIIQRYFHQISHYEGGNKATIFASTDTSLQSVNLGYKNILPGKKHMEVSSIKTWAVVHLLYWSDSTESFDHNVQTIWFSSYLAFVGIFQDNVFSIGGAFSDRDGTLGGPLVGGLSWHLTASDCDCRERQKKRRVSWFGQLRDDIHLWHNSQAYHSMI